MLMLCQKKKNLKSKPIPIMIPKKNHKRSKKNLTKLKQNQYTKKKKKKVEEEEESEESDGEFYGEFTEILGKFRLDQKKDGNT